MGYKTKCGIFIDDVEIAGGIIKTVEQARTLLRTDVTGELGTITPTFLPGNGGRDYHAEYMETGVGRVLLWGLNSLGLPNPGMQYVEDSLRDLILEYRSKGRELPINISADTTEEIVMLVAWALRIGFRRITINAACPNRLGHGLICQDKGVIDKLFTRLEEFSDADACLIYKVALGMDRGILAYNVQAINVSNAVEGIIIGNTIGGGLAYDSHGNTVISTHNGITRGGLSGPVVLGVALDDTVFTEHHLNPRKFTIACGGFSKASHVLAAQHLGAVGVQMNTAFREAGEDPRFITDIKVALHDLQHPTG